jgi:hypothetical protein
MVDAPFEETGEKMVNETVLAEATELFALTILCLLKWRPPQTVY